MTLPESPPCLVPEAITLHGLANSDGRTYQFTMLLLHYLTAQYSGGVTLSTSISEDSSVRILEGDSRDELMITDTIQRIGGPREGEIQASDVTMPVFGRRTFLRGTGAVIGLLAFSPVLPRVRAQSPVPESSIGSEVAIGRDVTLRGWELGYYSPQQFPGAPGNPFIQSLSGSGSTSGNEHYPASTLLDNFRNLPGTQTGSSYTGGSFHVTGTGTALANLALKGHLSAEDVNNISIGVKDYQVIDGEVKYVPFTSGSGSVACAMVVYDVVTQREVARTQPMFEKAYAGTEMVEFPSQDVSFQSPELSLVLESGRQYAVVLELRSTVTVGNYDPDEHYSMVSATVWAYVDSISVDWIADALPADNNEQMPANSVDRSPQADEDGGLLGSVWNSIRPQSFVDWLLLGTVFLGGGGLVLLGGRFLAQTLLKRGLMKSLPRLWSRPVANPSLPKPSVPNQGSSSTIIRRSIDESASVKTPRRSKKPLADLKRHSIDDPKLPNHIRGWLRNEQRRTGSKSPYKWRNPPGYEGGHPHGKPFVTHGDEGGLAWQLAKDNRLNGQLVKRFKHIFQQIRDREFKRKGM